MQRMNEILALVETQSTFDLGHEESGIEGCETIYSGHPEDIVTPAQMRAILRSDSGEDNAHARAINAQLVSPGELVVELEIQLSTLLQEYIDPETRRVGCAMPAFSEDSEGAIHLIGRGLRVFQTSSPLTSFTLALAKASAIWGAGQVTSTLSDWIDGEPLWFRSYAVLNGIYLSQPLEPLDGVRLDPLPQSVEDLPVSLQATLYSGQPGHQYLGQTLLSIECGVMPALFCPPHSLHERIVQICTAGGLGIDTICRALSLATNRYVSANLYWDQYDDSALFLRKEIESHYSFNSERARARRSTDPPIAELSVQQFIVLSESLKERSSDKLNIAISRWRKSKDPDEYDLADKFIDLRIALESLYLQNFRNEGNRTAEMRFRLALFGAWYLGSDLQERRDIRKKLIDVYDRASAAVHSGQVEDSEENFNLLTTGQNLCRQGILKFLTDGPPANWGDLVLGGGL